jgi:type II restriction enzyme
MMDISKAGRFKNGTQIARVTSEDWARRNLYCPACESNRLTQAKNNTKAYDFICPCCGARFQLKGSKRWNECRIPDAGYNAMMEAIAVGKNPNLVLMHYDNNWLVQNLLLIPSFFFSGSAVEKRQPLAVTARRAGWIGCNILLHSIPSVGKIAMVANGLVTDRSEVRGKYANVNLFSSLGNDVRGWTLDVFKIVEMLPIQFTLRDAYNHDDHLAGLHPDNRNIRPKIRQQLQVLRDMGMIKFLGNGRYLRI